MGKHRNQSGPDPAFVPAEHDMAPRTLTQAERYRIADHAECIAQIYDGANQEGIAKQIRQWADAERAKAAATPRFDAMAKRAPIEPADPLP